MVKVSDYVADFLAGLGVNHVFAVCGGGNMHLVDSIGNHPKLQYVVMHHEQACAMAADAYGRIRGMGACLVTTGPGGTNAITGVCCAWVDSTPMLVISGQVTRDTLLGGDHTFGGVQPTGLRQFGVQESDVATLAKSITKYAVTVMDEKMVRYELERAAHIATTGRKGPVWVDIPLDIQAKQIEPDECLPYEPIEPERQPINGFSACPELLANAKRPVLIVGNGARGSRIIDLIDALAIPVVTSWLAADMVADHPYHIGHCGLFGDRASNWAVQKADLILSIGCRLSIPQTGHNTKAFAPHATKIMADIDYREMEKPSLKIDYRILADATDFVEAMLGHPARVAVEGWLDQCVKWRDVFSVARDTRGLQSNEFARQLSEVLPHDAVVVVDTGTSFTCTYQTAKMKRGQRWISAAGHAPMGFSLPAAIGLHYATGKPITCIVGDGSLMVNLQELQTIASRKLPITIFVLENDGYLTIKHTQDNHYGRRVGADAQSGLSCLSAICAASAFGLLWLRWPAHVVSGPSLISVPMEADQPLIPRVQSIRNPDGSVSGGALEDMYPFLPRDELKQIMEA